MTLARIRLAWNFVGALRSENWCSHMRNNLSTQETRRDGQEGLSSGSQKMTNIINSRPARSSSRSGPRLRRKILAAVGSLLLGASLTNCSGLSELPEAKVKWTVTHENDSDINFPVWSGDTLFFENRNEFQAVDAESGDELWRVDSPRKGVVGPRPWCVPISADDTVACSFGDKVYSTKQQAPEVYFVNLANGNLEHIRIPDALSYDQIAATEDSIVMLTANSENGKVSVTEFDSSGQRGWSRVIDRVTFKDGHPRDSRNNHIYKLRATADHIMVTALETRSVVLDASTGEPRTPADSSGLNFVPGFGIQLNRKALAFDAALTNTATVYVDGQTKPDVVHFSVPVDDQMTPGDTSCSWRRRDDGPIVLCRTNRDQTEVVILSPGSDEPTSRLFGWGDAAITDVSDFGVTISSFNDGVPLVRLDPVTGDQTEAECQFPVLGPGNTSFDAESGPDPWTIVRGCDQDGQLWVKILNGNWYLSRHGPHITLSSDSEFKVLR